MAAADFAFYADVPFGEPCIELPEVNLPAGIVYNRETYWEQRNAYLEGVQEMTGASAFLQIIENRNLPRPINCEVDGKECMKCPNHDTIVSWDAKNMCECYSHNTCTYDYITDSLHWALDKFIKTWTDAGGKRYAKACLAPQYNVGVKPVWNAVEYFHETED
jgi:hypothetical protein